MLESVKPIPFLMLVYAHKGADVDVVIDAIDVGEGVVYVVVFDLPHETRSAHQVQRPGHQGIHRFVLGIGSMGSIVHHIESDAREGQTHQGAAGQSGPNGQIAEYQQTVNQDCGRKQYDRFGIERKVSGWLNAVLFEIGINSRLEGIEEGTIAVVEGDF